MSIDVGDKEKYYYDAEAAELAIAFIENFCTHIKGDSSIIGKPFLLEEWQKDITRKLFGVKRIADNKRRYRKVYVEIPKKNGKTPYAAALMLYALTALQREGGASVYCVATSTKQADQAMGWARSMALKSEALSSRLEVLQHSIVYPEKLSSLKILANSAATADGINASFILVDELHRHKSPAMLELMESSLAANSEGILFIITTAGSDRESVCYKEHEKAQGILDGTIIDDTYLPIIYAAPDDLDLHDDAAVDKAIRQANPNVDVSVSFEWLKQKVTEARQMPSRENAIKRYHFNIWTEQSTRWLPLNLWDENDKQFSEDDLKGKPCFLALDWAASQDLGALVAVFNNEFGGYDILPHFWLPAEDLAKKDVKDKVSYSAWVRGGFLEHVKNITLDENAILEKAKELAELYSVQLFTYDRTFLSPRIIQQLEAEGFVCFPHTNSYKDISPSSKELERALLNKAIRHNGHPVLRWNASNVEIDSDDQGNIRPRRPRYNSDAGKIDGLITAIMGITHAMIYKETKKKRYTPAIFV
jgi:phage terminase large subunit-like protein